MTRERVSAFQISVGPNNPELLPEIQVTNESPLEIAVTEDEGSSPIKEDQEENLHQLGIIHQHSRSWANFLLESD